MALARADIPWLLAWIIPPLSFIPALVLTFGRLRPEWARGLAWLELPFAAANLYIGIVLIREFTKPGSGEGGLGTLFFLLVAGLLVLLSLTMAAAAGLYLTGTRGANWLHAAISIPPCLAVAALVLGTFNWLLGDRP